MPYRNIAQYGPDLIAGTVPLGFQWYPERRRRRSAPRARSRSRSPATSASPRCPTRRPPPKPGCREYKVDGWFALLAPAGTPRPILERLNKELTAALNDPAVQQGFEKAGAETMALPLDQAKKFHADEIVKYRDIITKAGIAEDRVAVDGAHQLERRD